MNSLNHVVLLGNLTGNPRVTQTKSGKTVCDFGLALNRRWLDLNGDRQKETTFVDVTAWNQQAAPARVRPRAGSRTGRWRARTRAGDSSSC